MKATLKRLRASQIGVAEACGVHPSTVSLWLKGQVSSPNLDMGIPAYVAGLERGLELALERGVAAGKAA